MTELVVAMGIFTVAMIPLAFSFTQETRQCRALYHRAMATAVVDGEMEILVAGEWRAFQPGRHPYPVKSEAARQLPPGRFELTVGEKSLRLEWKPDKRGRGLAVAREAGIQ